MMLIKCRHCGKEFNKPSHRNQHEKDAHKSAKAAMTKDHNTEQAVSDLPPLPINPTAYFEEGALGWFLAYSKNPVANTKALFTADQMREYALAALSQVRGKALEPVAYGDRLGTHFASVYVIPKTGVPPWMARMTPLYAAAPQVGQQEGARVPLIPNQAMRDVMDTEGWQWEDLLAAAGAITEEQYASIAAAPQSDAQHIEKDALPICGDNPVLPARIVGCGKQLEREQDVYRCTHCDVPFHKDCANKHFKDDFVLTEDHINSMTPEEVAKAEAAIASREMGVR